MIDKGLKQIEQLCLRLSDNFDKKLEEQSENFEKMLKQQSEELRRWIGAEFEEFQPRLELVIKGQQMLSEKVDAVAAELSAHRKDTEAYHGPILKSQAPCPQSPI